MCRDTHLGDKIIKKHKEVSTIEVNVVVTSVELGKRVVNCDRTHRGHPRWLAEF